ncbi:helix-turn-helix domain-containing protein [Algoriphagus halophilus]|uniref:Helix-turn-helix domain-containing protein n=1 Tax=Algoriphagus halophilus TaxID=226505 RepID=A0A1N6HWH2_9BACT|nr:response regulator transcription factor [Algoriphagus halophilus]SIO23999.1 Helix-turn-helix domain-containing protein [Algoriphagus halophilus]
MLIKTPLPHSSLREIIKEYYYFQLNEKGTTKHIPIVDDCCHDFIVFKEANALFCFGDQQKTLNIKYKVFTILDLHPPYQLKFKDNLTFFTIKCQPWMNRYFFSEINESGVVNLENHNPQLLQIHQQMSDNYTIEEIVSTADDFFRNKQIVITDTVQFVMSVCQFIYSKKGILRVKEISNHFNKSRQYINKVFKQEAMCSLKTFIVSVRILNLIKHKVKHKELSLTRLSYDYGYFDQAHFINDFKKVSGLTPSQYFNRLPEFILRHT